MRRARRALALGLGLVFAVPGCAQHTDEEQAPLCPGEEPNANIVGTTPLGSFHGTYATYTATFPLECSGAHSIYIAASAGAFLEAAAADFADGPLDGGLLRLVIVEDEATLGPGDVEVSYGFYFEDDYLTGSGTLSLSRFDPFPGDGDAARIVGELLIEDQGVIFKGTIDSEYCSALADICA